MASIGLLSIGTYLPKQRMTAEDLAKETGIPAQIIENKLGIKEKPIPSQNDHTVLMGIRAAKEAIDKAGISPLDIDMVMYMGEEYKEYPVWTAGIKLQHEVGAHRAYSFDVSQRCGTGVLALKIAKDMMKSDPGLNTVLLAGGYRNIDLVNYQNQNTRFLFNLAAGGGAILLQKDHWENELLESHLITDGSFSEDVIIPAGGTKLPLTAEGLENGHHKFDVPNPAGMKERLDKKSTENFIACVKRAVEKSGYQLEDVGYIAMLHMKRSAHEYILQQLGIPTDKSIYLENYGHIGQFDQILSLELAERQGKLKQGEIVVLVSAGIGYAWGATVIRWGRN